MKLGDIGYRADPYEDPVNDSDEHATLITDSDRWSLVGLAICRFVEEELTDYKFKRPGSFSTILDQFLKEQGL